MKDYDIQVNEDESSKETGIVLKGLDDFNEQFSDPYHHKKLNVIVKDDGEVIGGLLGGTYWGWMYVDRLWIDDAYRKSGLGTRILEIAEDEARRRGCGNAHLDTHDFQAVEFYRKNGYEIAGCLENLPEGFNRYLMKKSLTKAD